MGLSRASVPAFAAEKSSVQYTETYLFLCPAFLGLTTTLGAGVVIQVHPSVGLFGPHLSDIRKEQRETKDLKRVMKIGVGFSGVRDVA